MRDALFGSLILLACLAASSFAGAGEWVRPGVSTNLPLWGSRDGLLWAVAPAGFRAGEPRGLIRLGYPVLPDKRYDLINFIATEGDLAATVNGRYTCWLSARPIPPGAAFENFELRERFYDGQKFVFGITRRTPLEPGFKP